VGLRAEVGRGAGSGAELSWGGAGSDRFFGDRVFVFSMGFYRFFPLASVVAVW
jgi:hypothetical protein